MLSNLVSPEGPHKQIKSTEQATKSPRANSLSKHNFNSLPIWSHDQKSVNLATRQQAKGLDWLQLQDALSGLFTRLSRVHLGLVLLLLPHLVCLSMKDIHHVNMSSLNFSLYFGRSSLIFFRLRLSVFGFTNFTLFFGTCPSMRIPPREAICQMLTASYIEHSLHLNLRSVSQRKWLINSSRVWVSFFRSRFVKHQNIWSIFSWV